MIKFTVPYFSQLTNEITLFFMSLLFQVKLFFIMSSGGFYSWMQTVLMTIQGPAMHSFQQFLGSCCAQRCPTLILKWLKFSKKKPVDQQQQLAVQNTIKQSRTKNMSVRFKWQTDHIYFNHKSPHDKMLVNSKHAFETTGCCLSQSQ